MKDSIQIKNPENPASNRLRLLSDLFCLYALAGGVISFTAWAADIPRLADWNLDGISIQPNSTIAVVMAGLAALLMSRGTLLSYVSATLAVIVTFIGLYSLFQIVTAIDVGLDTILMFGREWGRTGTISAGRVGTPAAVSWSLIGISLVILSYTEIKSGMRSMPRLRLLAVSLVLVTLVISGLSFTGYIYGAETLYSVPRLTVIALQTATFIFFISLGIVLGFTDVGPARILADESPTGLMFRRIVPMIVAVPIMLGLLQLLGAASGFYDRPFGTAASTVAEIILLLSLLWWTGRSMLDTTARRTAIIQTALDCIISIDHAGRITEFNPAAEETFGYRREDVIGQELASVIIPPAYREAHRKGLVHFLATGEGPVLNKRIELSAIRADGGEFPVELSITRIPLSGNPQFTAYLRDITDRKKAAEVLQSTLDSLEDQVQKRTAKLNKTNKALKTSNDELEQFASVASHDLQEPLRKIQAFGDRLQTSFADRLDEKGRDYIERMLSSAARMRSLIDSLLTFSRVTTKAQPFVPVDLLTIAKEVVSDLEARIHLSGGRVEIVDLPSIDADPTQMQQLFLNLIGNGLKFHKPDVPPVVRVEGQIVDNSGMCEIVVADNGIGFEEIYLDRIFEVFQRLHGRNEFEGTGMGLALCRKIVERHGGSITATSSPGHGAKFIVALPVRHNQVEENE